MLLADSEIKAAIKAEELLIEPFEETCLEAASYDARIGPRAILGGSEREVDMAKAGSLTVHPGEFVLILTEERFRLDNKMVGHIGVKSYYTRKGFVILAGLQIDPGFDGHLVIGGYNAAPRRLTLDYQAPFLTVEFHRLAVRVDTPYTSSGVEQIQGQIPRIDKDYLRTLETQSLSDLSEELRKLTQSVAGMQTQFKTIYAPLLVGTLVAVVGFGLASLFS